MDSTTQEAIYESLETLRDADQYYQWLHSQVKQYIRGKTLEIGAGIGNFARWGQQTADEYHVSDVDPRLVERLSHDYKKAFEWDLYKAFPGDTFYDSIVILNVIEHLHDDKAAVQAIHSRLAPNGNLIVMVPAMQFLYGSLDKSFGHYRRYTISTMSKVMEDAKFQILKRRYVNVVGMAGWFIYGRIFKHKNLPQQLCSRFNLVLPLLRLERPIAHFMGLSLIIVGKKKEK
jgi:2-polyprenyl-3-methyl-5-hydroxy-6-metoxy-1,4-benzoquinol methylase